MSEGQRLQFPPNFVWGASTSAYQIEGATNEDGRGPSTWDTFCRKPGRVRGRQNGDIAIDHYHRWKEDIALMASFGLKAYRFSIAWPRVIPAGAGAVNPAGLDFYSRLVDGLLEKGITPYPTLYHYDTPLALQEKGGWTNRDTALAFGDYARVLSEKLSDRVTHWITLNEPWVVAFLGYLTGQHAPGQHNPWAALSAAHHQLLAHGCAVQALRAAAHQPLQVGIALNLTPVYPASESKNDKKAAAFFDGMMNRIFLDPLLKGQYPDDFTSMRVWRWLEKGLKEPSRSAIRGDDLKVISQPLDFLGFNYYTRGVIRYVPIVQAMQVQPKDSEYSEMWEIYPPGMYDLLKRLNTDYGHPNLIVTENGIPVPDQLLPDGTVHDQGRINYLNDHIAQVHRAISEGIPVTGYFAWSMFDNFEWALGYSKRFGMVYVDYATQKRYPKDSASWYAAVIRQNGLIPRQ